MFGHEFVGGSHDGEYLEFEEDFPVDFKLAIDMRVLNPTKYREVYVLDEEGKFRYINKIVELKS